MNLWLLRGRMGRTESELGSTVHTAIFKMDNQQGPISVQIYVAAWMGEEFGGEWICVAESLCCLPETITTCLIGYTPISNKKLKKY